MITEQTEQDFNEVLLNRSTGEELLGTNVIIKVLMSCVIEKLTCIENNVKRFNNSYIEDYINDTMQLLYLIEEHREKGFNLLDPLLKELGI